MNISTFETRVKPRRRALAPILALLSLVLTLGVGGMAYALPPDGPAPDSPGTSSRVWPAEVAPGDLLYFEVSGYPANETVYIKIDDGLACSDTSQGACVYATQALDANGYASGSIVVPDLAPGAHWLRMLATGDIFDSKTGEKLGYQGYTRRGGNDFTIISGGTGGSSQTNGGGTANGAGTGVGGAVVVGAGQKNADGSVAGGNIALNVDESATPEEMVTAESAQSMDDITTKIVEDQSGSTANATAEETGSSVPVVGIAVLAAAVVIGGGAIGWAVVRRQRLMKAMNSGTGQ